MATWPNASQMFASPYKRYGQYSHFLNYRIAGDRMNRFAGTSYGRTSSAPDGYDMRAYVPPIKAGGMSSWQPTSITGAATASQVNATTLAGTTSLTWSSDSIWLTLHAKIDGTTNLTMGGDGIEIEMVLAASGSGTFTMSGQGDLSMIVPFDGLGQFTVTGVADLRGQLSMVGEWTPFTELSPGNLADAVWAHNTLDHLDPDTAGGKLNAAGSASNPWVDPVGQAVAERVDELHKIKGLDVANPVAASGDGITAKTVTAGDITLSITSSGITRT